MKAPLILINCYLFSIFLYSIWIFYRNFYAPQSWLAFLFWDPAFGDARIITPCWIRDSWPISFFCVVDSIRYLHNVPFGSFEVCLFIFSRHGYKSKSVIYGPHIAPFLKFQLFSFKYIYKALKRMIKGTEDWKGKFCICSGLCKILLVRIYI
jgi:hypothetical protein